jgi:hypothetical protein
MKIRFSLRDLFLLLAIVGMLAAWWIDHWNAANAYSRGYADGRRYSQPQWP